VTKTEDYGKKFSMKNLAEDLRNAKNKMAVGNFLEDIHAEPLFGLHHCDT
jgi:hypothetical protein